MDWKSFGISALAVYGTLFVSGIIISVLSGQLQCSKIGLFESISQGSFSALLPSVVYMAAVYFEFVRSPFAHTLTSFGIPADTSEIVGVGYLIMLSMWISTVWNIHYTEKNVCVSSADEMSKFKQDMLSKLQSKEEEKEKNKDAK
jgi:hypothetical protein